MFHLSNLQNHTFTLLHCLLLENSAFFVFSFLDENFCFGTATASSMTASLITPHTDLLFLNFRVAIGYPHCTLCISEIRGRIKAWFDAQGRVQTYRGLVYVFLLLLVQFITIAHWVHLRNLHEALHLSTYYCLTQIYSQPTGLSQAPSFPSKVFRYLWSSLRWDSSCSVSQSGNPSSKVSRDCLTKTKAYVAIHHLKGFIKEMVRRK